MSRSMFVPEWYVFDLTTTRVPGPGDPPLDFRDPVTLSPCPDFDGAKKIAETSAGKSLKWEECKTFSDSVARARGPRAGKDGWYMIWLSK